MKYATTFEIIEEGLSRKQGTGTEKGKKGGMEGALVGLLWKSHEDGEHSDWGKNTVGEVGPVEAEILAAAHNDYKSLAKLGDAPITTIQLNESYHGLKNYISARARSITPDSIEAIRSRYAVGTGVGLCMLYNEQERCKEKGDTLSDEWLAKAHEALSRSVLSMLPEFDKLAREAGMEDI